MHHYVRHPETIRPSYLVRALSCDAQLSPQPEVALSCKIS